MEKVNKPLMKMNSIGEECNELKQSYDACFNVWFAEKFLKSEAKEESKLDQLKNFLQDQKQSKTTDDSMCKPIFLVYRDCVRVSLSVVPY